MANENKVTKIYQLSTLGFNELNKELTAVNTLFEKIKKSKLSAQGKLFAAADATDVKKYADELAKLTVEEQRLRTETQRLANETKALQLIKAQESNQRKQSKQTNDAEAGSIARIREEIKSLGAAIIKVRQGSGKLVDFNGQLLQYDNALKKLKSLTKEEQDYRRQFNRDGLLVAEYTSGFAGVGKKISDQLSNNFKQLKGQLASFILSYVAFQSLSSTTSKIFGDTVKLDSLDSSLKSVSKSEQELATNQQFLIATTEKLGLEYISSAQAFKNFYAASTQAGISADETRKIFFAASAASANLKLSQEDTNGVLLAFSQIASKGKVQAEELRGQIGERVPGAFAIAARAIGVTQIELNKMLEQGQVISSEFLPKFAAELQRTFGGNSNEKVAGLQASINRLKNEFTSLIKDNQGGLSSLFSTFINGATYAVKALPTLIVLIGALTLEMTRLYIANQLATAGTVLYTLKLELQALWTRAVALGTRIATYEIVLFNGAIRISPIGAFLTILALVVPAVALFANRLQDAKREQSALNEINKAASSIYIDQISKLDTLKAIIKSTVTSMDTKRKAVEDMIKIDGEFSKVMKDNIIDLNELDKAYKKVTDSIMMKARVEATAKLAAEKQASVNQVSLIRGRIQGELADQQKNNKNFNGIITINDKFTEEDRQLLTGGFFGNRFTKAVPSLRSTGKGIQFLADDFNNFINELDKIEVERITVLQDYLTFSLKAQEDLEKTIKGQGASVAAFEVDVKGLKEKIEALDKEINLFQGDKTIINAKIAERKKLQAELDKILGTNNSTNKSSRLTVQQKDAFKDIDAERDKLLATEKQRRIENKIDEETYIKSILKINTDAINQKLAVLKRHGEDLSKLNAEERKQVAELNLEKVTNEQETNKKVFDIRIAQRKALLEEEIRIANKQAQDILNDPESSESQRAKARLNADTKILSAQVSFGHDLDKLEKDLAQQSLQNEKESADEIIKVRQQLIEDQRALTEAEIKDIEEAGNRSLAAFKAIITARRLLVISSNKLTPGQKQRATTELDKQESLGGLGIEADVEKRKLLLYKKLLLEKKITDKEYQKFLDEEFLPKMLEYNTAIENATKNTIDNVTDLKGFLQKSVRDLFKVGAGTEEDKLFGETISQSYQLASDAMGAYFDEKKARIDQERDMEFQRLDEEKQRLLNRAQSSAEEISIEKQFNERKDAISRAAFEKQKKIQLEQAKINLAIQLSNLAVIAFAPNPANIATLGTVGAIMYGIQAAVALGQYALRVREINSAKYEFGGIPKRGGEIGGRPHSEGGTPFNYEAEKGELAIIRTRDAENDKIYQMIGTHRQIASALNQAGGGMQFEAGAKVKKFAYGGNLGETLQPPVFIPKYGNSNGNGITKDDMASLTKELVKEIKGVASEQSKRIDRIEVVLSTKKVTSAQNKEAKQTEAGLL